MKLLLVTSRYPWPPRRGDQLRAAQMLDLLAGEHEVTLLAPAPSPRQRQGAELEPEMPAPAQPHPRVRVELYRAAGWPGAIGGMALALARGLPLESGLFYHPDLGRRLRRLAPGADLVVLQLARLAAHAGDAGATPLVVDLVDSLALNLERRAAVDRAWLRAALRHEAHLLARAERKLAERARVLLVVCARDRDALAGRLGPELASRLRVVPLALAAAAGARQLGEEADGGPQRAGSAGAGGVEPVAGDRPLLAFTGNLGYFVNVDALTWFLREVWPALRERRPQVRLLVAGDRPARAVRQAVARLGPGSGVLLQASPPALRALLAGATVALAPLRAGSGLPLKILEAWSAGVPVVASPWAAAGTTARPGEDLRIAEAPEQWLAAVVDLLDHPAERARLAENGRRRLAADYSPEVVRERWQAALAAAVR